MKTASKGYPTTYIHHFELEEKGDYKAVYSPSTADPKSPELMTFVWLDRERRYFISSCSNVSEGREYTRKRWRQVTDVNLNRDAEHVEFTIPQPKAAEIYYTCCSKIDYHNRDRQDALGIEKKLRTKNWSKRVNFTLLSMNFVDTWKVWNLTTNEDDDVARNIPGDPEHAQETQQQFYSSLLVEMIENKLDDDVRETRNAATAQVPMPTIPGLVDRATGRVRSGIDLHLTPTRIRKRRSDGTYTNFAFQGRCQVCHSRTTSCCSMCVADPDCPNDGWLCHTKSKPCFLHHASIAHGH